LPTARNSVQVKRIINFFCPEKKCVKQVLFPPLPKADDKNSQQEIAESVEGGKGGGLKPSTGISNAWSLYISK
jgi:hypothetical protein